jgi:hypothetical protein
MARVVFFYKILNILENKKLKIRELIFVAFVNSKF